MITIIQNGPICRISNPNSAMLFFSQVSFNNPGLNKFVAVDDNGIKFLTSKLDKIINLIFEQNLTVEQDIR